MEPMIFHPVIVIEPGGGLLALLALLLAFAVIVFGVWSAMAGRVEWSQLWVYVLAGLLLYAAALLLAWRLGPSPDMGVEVLR